MSITLSSVISEVRDTIADETATYRTSDAKMITYGNRFVRAASMLRPDLFSTIDEITCTSGTCIQSAPAAAYHLIDVFQVKDGQVVIKTERKLLDRFNRSWMTDTAAAAQNWARHEANPKKFFIYPKAPADQILIAEWAVLPTAFSATSDTLPTPLEQFAGAMHDFMVACSEGKDDENVMSGRVELFYKLFAGAFKVSADSREYMQGAEVKDDDKDAR